MRSNTLPTHIGTRGAWLVEEPSGKLMAYGPSEKRFVNSSRAAFDDVRDFASDLTERLGMSDDIAEEAARRLAEVIASVDPAATSHPNSWWQAFIDGVLRC